jgi:CheY-like chemotaxis protein
MKTLKNEACDTLNQPELTTEAANRPMGNAVLIMDDEDMILDMAAEMLDYLGYTVTTCKDGAEAVALYKAAQASGKTFAAAIVDLTVPGGLGGKEAAREILAIDPKACLVVSSGYSNDQIISDYRSYGFSAAVAKPYNVIELGRQLTLALSLR